MSKVYWVGGTSSLTTDANTAANWSTGSLPVNGDDVYIEAPTSGSTFNITTSLSSLSGVTLNSLNIAQNYTGTIGTTAAYWQISATTINIGYSFSNSSSSGSTLIKLNVGTVQTTVNVINSAQTSSLSTGGPIAILGTHASNVLNVINGTVSVAAVATEVATFATINNDGNITIGPGVTLTTLNNTSTCKLRCGATTINFQGGTLTTSDSGAITNLNANSGTAKLNSTGTITNLNVFSSVVDFSASPASRTVTNCTIYNQGSLNLNNGVKNSITMTNGIITKANPGQYTITPWTNSTITLS